MLQCSGCGGLVSEWAASCPDCGHGVDDALDIAEPEVVPPRGPASDPYYDPAYTDRPVAAPIDDEPPGAEDAPAGEEPPRALHPKRVGRATALTAGIAVVAAGTTLGVWSSTGGGGTTGLRSLYGQVVAATQSGAASVVPATGRAVKYRVLDGATRFTPVAVSPDGTTWLGSTGTVVTVLGDRVTARSTTVAAAMSGATTPAIPDPFVGGERSVVMLHRPTPTSSADASIIDLVDGHRHELGVVDTAAGDPQTLGAFVSVPVEARRARKAQPAVADADVELRSEGAPPEVLATAAQLDQDVGWSASRLVQLGVFPSPTGDAIAVVLTTLDPVQGDSPMVVLNREGAVLATLDDWTGPMYGAQPVWSPGAHQLAYPTYTTNGPALAIGSETGSISAIPAPAGTIFGACIWSVSSTDVVCQTTAGNQSRWLYAIPAADHLLSTASPGQPVGWIAGPP